MLDLETRRPVSRCGTVEVAEISLVGGFVSEALFCRRNNRIQNRPALKNLLFRASLASCWLPRAEHKFLFAKFLFPRPVLLKRCVLVLMSLSNAQLVHSTALDPEFHTANTPLMWGNCQPSWSTRRVTLGVRTLPALLTLSSKTHEPIDASGSPLYLWTGT